MEGPFTGEGFDVEVDGPLMGLEGGEEYGCYVGFYIEEGDAKAHEYGIMFIETSAKAGLNIKSLFHKIVAALPGMETLS
ncbi:Ras-related protein RABH1e [Acorus calamus]|uniref:Ras-related protein RABH1e n=1 Tax=Acorus calamus TaxID=4465 RepID=A0AAV9E450_ACOCL|nr:Ras-related protein RABH1e [Acorus calamus]